MSARQSALRISSLFRTLVVVGATGLVIALALARTADAALPHVVAFETPDADVNCAWTKAPPTIPQQSLVCTAPKGYVVMQPTGPARTIVWNKPFSPLGGQPATPLKNGAQWKWDSISCSVSWWTISCTNQNGQNRFTVGRAPNTPNSVPVLGSGGVPRVGFGSSEPAEVYFGGDPTGMFKHLSWSNWGYAEATARGSGYYDPPHAPTAASVPTPVILTASSLGVCHGKLAYRELAVTFIYKGHDEAGSRQAICG